MKKKLSCIVLIMLLAAGGSFGDELADRLDTLLLELNEAIEGNSAQSTAKALETIEWCRKAVSSDTLSPQETADCYYLIAFMYDRLIDDAASWMAYGTKQRNYLRLCLDLAPRHVGARLLLANTLLTLPESAGGNPGLGRAALTALHSEHPDDIRIILLLARESLGQDELAQAKALLAEALGIDSGHLAALRLLEQIELMERRPIIRSILLAGDMKTSKNRLYRKLSPFIGSTYTSATDDAIAERITRIRSIRDSTLSAERSGADGVVLTLQAREDNMIMLGAMGIFGLSMGYDKTAMPNGNPAFLYADQNFLGSADRVMLIFAGPYINVDYYHAGLINDGYLDMRLNWESMFLAIDSAPVIDGRVLNEERIRSPAHALSLGLGKEFAAGVSVFLDMKLTYESWAPVEGSTALDFLTPTYSVKYQPGLDFSFSTVPEGGVSGLDAPTGFYARLRPSLVYIPGYAAWGGSGALAAHDIRPQWMISAAAGYTTPVSDRQAILIGAEYKAGGNMYKNNEWTAGKVSPANSGAPLDGFYANEFSFANGILGNAAYHVKVIRSRLSALARYSAFFDCDRREAHHGVAFALSGKLPFNVEFTGQLGIGLNAERRSGMGYEIDLSISRLWFF